MAIYSCNRYKIIILLLLALIVWQIFRLLPVEPRTQKIEIDLAQLEDDKYNSHKENNVKIRVYYETLCPDSKHFFNRHLSPVTEKLEEFIHVTLIPYGKATTKYVDGQYIFECQHGPDECYANKVHSCAIDGLKNMTMAVKMTTCMINDNIKADAALERCAKELQIDAKPIHECANSDRGSALLKKHGDDTHLLKLTFVPTIILNRSRENQAAILKNFLLEVCKLIDIPLPPPCL